MRTSPRSANGRCHPAKSTRCGKVWAAARAATITPVGVGDEKGEAAHQRRVRRVVHPGDREVGAHALIEVDQLIELVG